MSSAGISSVEKYTTSIRELLRRAQAIKPNGDIEPALVASNFEDGIAQLSRVVDGSITKSNQAHYAAIETAFRNIFYESLASSSIDDPSFTQVWNLLDIVSILSDNEQCEPGLIFWLVEELLDSQTIDGCRSVFDYLDSRRERITAKHFKQKHLIILRACNELLRRLSRAEDTVFCGRVFIFLFQSFPLGDRSSVNLRGEYHTENVTTYDNTSPPSKVVEDSMAIDGDGSEEHLQNGEEGSKLENTEATRTAISDATEKVGKIVKFDTNPESLLGAIPDLDMLYPLFWALQDNFSTPTKLFDSSNFQRFKGGLESTLHKFKDVHNDLEVRGATRASDEAKRGTKRKRGSSTDELSSSFNPKYLTSRDLFELEVSDLAFRRHILVQALIIVDFLLSLTPRAKTKLENMTNKSVLYSYTLSEEDSKWASQMRSDIATYLQQGPEGKFYYRMVDTVLARDKNWVRWKAEGCPPIERPAISAEDFVNARSGAQKACANKRLRAKPMGSLDLKFLSDAESLDGLEKLKDPERFSVPPAESFKSDIVEDEFDIERAKTDEDKHLATSARASKLWRMLRVASKSKLNLLDKIDDGNNWQALFEQEETENRGKREGEGSNEVSKKSPVLEPAEPVTSQLAEPSLDATSAQEAVIK